jgi:ABC-type antimicrobial peptide transport system permease subunit
MKEVSSLEIVTSNKDRQQYIMKDAYSGTLEESFNEIVKNAEGASAIKTVEDLDKFVKLKVQTYIIDKFFDDAGRKITKTKSIQILASKLHISPVIVKWLYESQESMLQLEEKAADIKDLALTSLKNDLSKLDEKIDNLPDKVTRVSKKGFEYEESTTEELVQLMTLKKSIIDSLTKVSGAVSPSQTSIVQGNQIISNNNSTTNIDRQLNVASKADQVSGIAAMISSIIQSEKSED